MKRERSARAKPSRAAQDYDMLYKAGKLTEFAIVCKAKDGDKAALEWVWCKYRQLMVGMIGRYWWYHRLTEGQMESEATMALIHKIEIFNPKKIKKTPEEWRFKFMLINAAWHCRNRLKTAAEYVKEHEVEYTEVDAPPNSERIVGKAEQTEALEANRSLYEEYGPEEITINKLSEESLPEKEKKLMDALTPFQRTLLQFRRAGLTVQQIADQMGCGFTKIRLQIVQARELAYQILEIEKESVWA